MRIPLIPFPLEKVEVVSKPLLGVANLISRATPSMKLNLYQAEFPFEPREYISLVLFSSIFYFVLLFGLTFSVGLYVGTMVLSVPLIVGTMFFLFTFFYLMNYPRLVALKRINSLEKDLLNALQHMLIEVKSGIPLFDAMNSVSEGYGEVSHEFREVSRKISSGITETQALDEASKKNPSLFFRRSIWQLVNALRAGSDISNALENIVNNLVSEQVIAVRKYSQQLNPYTMMYMLVSVILPTLGITFLLILTSFSGLVIPKMVFLLILLAVGMFQFFFMGLIKMKRPVMQV